MILKDPSLVKKRDAMAAAGAIVAEALNLVARTVAPGVRTGELDAMVEELIRSRGALPSFKGYNGYPASVCTSVNDEIVHGIPGPRRLVSGDILSVDVGAFLGGYHGDAALTIPVGDIDELSARLIRVTRASLEAALTRCRAGNHIGDVGSVVQTMALEAGFQVVRDFTGHGIGRRLHERPQIPNYGRPGAGPVIRSGDALAVEPMINAGTMAIKILEDNWTAVTYDGSRSAHFEHTVFVGERGAEILTPWDWRWDDL
ncbi:MAG: type I methionyl aminopeptidase [Candidatus Coatesbacteria bacterium RBG_13_66_14]|uniref:Methionine aminopeptidase n=1 Tax=Candidatus Coatesbacteria bacterium RBG_13_66_14 TaxID=1817816 RepID=A0A1F5F213_9BACT|nr:MAG: type I methionyl aminopeptidase [Candidatus Coatesbacteria bacterium RBG_13_66_14]